MRRFLAICALCLLGGVHSAPAGELALTPEQLLRTGQMAIDARRPDVAAEIADALLRRNPEDAGALVLKSQALRDLGRFDEARALAKAAWRQARTGPERHEAALARAQAEASDGRRTTSQFWLRRAIQEAPDERAHAQAVRDFRYVRKRDPLRMSFGFGIAPSSNINGGSSAQTLWLYGIPFTLSGDAQALSGTEARLSFGVDYRIASGKTHQTRIGANLSSQRYWLSSEARRQAPMADADDYAFAAAEVFVSHEARPADWKAPWDVRLTLGHNSYGGDALSNYARVDLGKDLALAGPQGARVSAGLERQWRLDRADRSATVQTVQARYGRAVAGGGLAFGVKAARVRSASSSIDHTALGLSADYALARPVGGARLGLHASAEARDYDASPYDPSGREDLKLGIGVSALLQDLDYMGFAPEVSLNATRTNSNVALFETRDIGVSIGLRSAF